MFGSYKNEYSFFDSSEAITIEAAQGEPIKLKTTDDDDVIGVLSQKQVVNFTEESSLMVGYKQDD